ncbi:hypothetical protein KPH14_012742 [Odynerus spinipes]|uniref:Retrotransposon gag domain-containing protein n=1 Tax=Odynerus spinipes TaxID=1348599 RepID=A0AAD9R926_9HYME|nr:hypothetical protein KPH14_012742 [Odynerus spinipes]
MAVSRSPQNTTASGQRCEEQDEIRNIDEEWTRLRREREELEKLRMELNKARVSSVAANTRSNKKKNADKGNEVVSDIVHGTEHRTVSYLTEQTQYLQLDIKVDKFSDENQKNPCEFLDEVEKYFKFKGVREEHKTLVCESFLEGRAKFWADTVSNITQPYTEFRCKFLKEFYSIPVQVKLKNQWLSRRYRQQEGALQDYFYKQIRAARYFEPEMSTYEINYSVAQQFPIRIREALSTVDYSCTSAMVQALAQLESIQRERETERRRNLWEEGRANNQRNGVANI